MSDEQPEDEKILNLPTAWITLAAVIAGVVLILNGHEAYGGICLSFALGGATMKPLIRGDK